MYEVKLYNNGQETLIHTLNPKKEAPHLLNLPFKESLSQPEEVSFEIQYNNPGFSLIEGLKTKIKVFDKRDNSVVFSGRVLPVTDGMTSNGKFNKTVICEGALAYLNDSHTRRWNFKNQTPTQILTYLLNEHNSKVDSERQIQLGTVETTQPITIDTNYETSLNAIITKIRNILGGDIRVREINDILYLDYLTAQGANNGVEIKLKYNLKEIIREYDPADVVTRALPLGYGEGINQLDITSVNAGVEYVEDSGAIAEYGVIEGVITNKDIQNADTLKIYGQTVLAEKKQPRLTYEQTALDLSVLSGKEYEKYELGDTLHTIVDILSIDVYSRVIERERDLLVNPWNPKLTISTRPIKLTDQIINLKQRNLTLENAPQGNTCIFPLCKAENADSTHPLTFDLDIPKETVNINRVYINLHGRKYRADSKDVAAGGGTTATSASGGGTTATSASNGGSNLTSSNGGSSSPSSGGAGWTGSGWGWSTAYGEYGLFRNVESGLNDYVFIPRNSFSHYHNVNVPSHNHSITTPNHTHDVDIPEHTHDVDIPEHTHQQVYGIVESTYPKNVKIKVNETDISVNYGDGLSAINEYDIDITQYVDIGNNKIEISTEENGRIEAIIYSQIFIQSK